MSEPVDDLFKLFQSCLAVPREDIRASAEQNITKFIDLARKLEVYFIQKKLFFKDGDEDKEDIAKLRNKVQTQQQLLQSYRKKIADLNLQYEKYID